MLGACLKAVTCVVCSSTYLLCSLHLITEEQFQSSATTLVQAIKPELKLSNGNVYELKIGMEVHWIDLFKLRVVVNIALKYNRVKTTYNNYKHSAYSSMPI